jgi:hypothetical protein
MIRSKRSAAGACGPALCACILAASFVAAPGDPGPAPAAPPAIHLTASVKPLAVDVPELIAHVPEFAGLVEPLVGPGAAPAQPAAAAAPTALAARTSIGIEIANALAWLPGRLFRALADGTFSPLVTGTPVIGPLIGNIIFFTSTVGLGVAYAVGYAIMAIESAIWTVVDAIGGAVGGLFQLPAAALSGAAPTGALRTATAFTTEEDAQAEPADEATHKPISLPSDDAVDAGTEVPTDEDLSDTTAASEVTVPVEVEYEPAAEPDELGQDESDEEDPSNDADDETFSEEEEDLTTEPSASEEQGGRETADEDPAPTSPSADSAPADRDDAPDEI